MIERLNPDLSAHIPGLLRAQVAAALRAAPWIWPLDGRGLAAAWRLVPEGPPLAAAVGVAPLLTINEEAGLASLWALGAGETPLTGDAARCLSRGAAALGRSLPALWMGLHDALQRVAPRAGWLLSLQVGGEVIPRAESHVEGESVGLSVALGLASRALDRPLPGDLVATATLDADGVTGPVGGLAMKLRLVAQGAPRLRRVLLHPSQIEAGRAALEGLPAPPELLPVASLHEGLRQAFGAELAEELLASTPPERRASRIEALFHLALSDHGRAFAWEPVARTAELIQASGWPLQGAQRAALEATAAIAQRHVTNRGAAPLPDPRWLSQLPAPRRVHLIAHLVQQSADSASPPPEEAEALAMRHLVRGLDAFPPHLRLLGALARLVEVQGRREEAAGLQREALQGWLRLGEHGADLAFPLAALYRLGVSRLVPLEEIDEAHDRALILAAGAPEAAPSNPFVRLWRGAARRDGAVLASLAQEASLPDHVRASAARQLGRLDPAAALPRTLLGALRDRRVVATFVALLELDAALHAGRSAEPALLALLDAMPQPTAALCAAATARGADLGVWVAEAFPY